jgi:hypothetical protein
MNTDQARFLKGLANCLERDGNKVYPNLIREFIQREQKPREWIYVGSHIKVTDTENLTIPIFDPPLE